MFSKKKNLLFKFEKEKRVSLHMLFVFFPIWVVYLNEGKEVVYVKKLLPFISCIKPKKKAKYILELVEDPRTIVGDRVGWQNEA